MSECQSNFDNDKDEIDDDLDENSRNPVMRGTVQSTAGFNYEFSNQSNQRRTLSNFNDLRSHQFQRMTANENLRDQLLFNQNERQGQGYQEDIQKNTQIQ